MEEMYETIEAIDNLSLDNNLSLDKPTNLNLLDLPEDCLNKIGKIFKEDNMERLKKEYNEQDLCYICQEETGDSECNICEYMCCSWCKESRPDMFLTEEQLEIFLKVANFDLSDDDEAANEIDELISENEDWLPDEMTNDYDVCEWCYQYFDDVNHADRDE